MFGGFRILVLFRISKFEFRIYRLVYHIFYKDSISQKYGTIAFVKIIGLFLAIVFLSVAGVVLISNQGVKPKDAFTTDVKRTILPITPQAKLTPAKKEPEDQETVTVNMQTSKGTITLTLFQKEAPKTVENFINKAKSGFYNNLTFHRVEDWVVQGGDPKGTGAGGGNMPTELNDKPFVVGSLGVARRNDIKVSNDAQFFITKTESPHLNNQYTNFGIVEAGMEVVNSLEVGDKILGITVG